MGPIFGLLGLGGLLFGLINLVHPTGRLGVDSRKRAGSALGASFGVLLLGAVLTPEAGAEPRVEATAATTGTAVEELASTSTLAVTSTSSTSTTSTIAVTTTTTTPLPDVPQADAIFGAATNGPSGNPFAPMVESAVVATVASITDGDTLEVTLPDGAGQTVRLIGVNTPESGECWADEAALALQTLVPVGSDVGLTIDISDRDQFDRLLRYLWVGSMSVNEELVRRGAGISRRYPPDTGMADRFESAQAAANAASLGLWAPDACGPAADADLSIVELVADATGDDNENLNGEWVQVHNDGANLVDMSAWGVKDESASHRYVFPTGFTLAPGESVTVYTGCGDDFGTDLYWCAVGSAVWNNDGDTAFLTDPNGNTHSSLPYVAPTTTTSSTTTTEPSGGGGEECHPSYQGACVPVGVEDVDCAAGSGNGPFYVGRVTVVGHDEYGLDRDGDGVGCE